MLPDDWNTAAKPIRQISRGVIRVSSGRKVDKKTYHQQETGGMRKCRNICRKGNYLRGSEALRLRKAGWCTRQHRARRMWQRPNKVHVMTSMLDLTVRRKRLIYTGLRSREMAMGKVNLRVNSSVKGD